MFKSPQDKIAYEFVFTSQNMHGMSSLDGLWDGR